MPADLARGFTPALVHSDEPEPLDPIAVTVEGETPDGATVDDDGVIKIETGDGQVIIDLNPQPDSDDDKDGTFDENLALKLPPGELHMIAGKLLPRIESDDKSREKWLQTRAKGIDLLGFELEEPRGDSASSTAPVEGMSTVRHFLLTEACLRFQSNASAELLPTAGPVKVRNDGGETEDNDELAEALERDMNHYLTAVDKGYRADTDRMLFWVGFGGCGFKKVYNCPIKRMPLSRSVDARDLIISNDANDTDDAGRITHRILMRRSILRRMQIAGVYRDIIVGTPYEQPNAVDEKIAAVQGFEAKPQEPEDHEHTIFEVYCELDILGYEHKDKGKITGLELPYRVTIEKDSKQVLEIRRNWREDDDSYLAKKVFVKFPFVPALGFYDIGLLHILGNADRALTGAWRMMLDAAMFASFPGFLYADTAGRQTTNEFRVPPGGGVKIQTGSRSIHDVIMPLPYKDPGAGLVALAEKIEQSGQRVGGVGDLPASEGKLDAPVGTTLAMIEQSTKVLAAVHIRLHAAQSEEFQLLKERFRDDPEAFWRNNKRPSMAWADDKFLRALDDYDLVPAADPNTPSHMHRLMKAVAIKQLQMTNPQIYDAQAVDSLILSMIGIGDASRLFTNQPPPQEPPGPPPDPAKMAAVQQKAQQAQLEMQMRQQEHDAEQVEQQRQHAARMQEITVESGDRAADRKSREQVAQTREDTERMKVQGEQQRHEQQLQHDAQKHAADQQLQVHQSEQQHHLAAQQQHHEQSMGMQEHSLQADQQQHEQTLSTQEHQQQSSMDMQKHEADQDNIQQDREFQADQSDQDRQAKMDQTKTAAKAKGMTKPKAST